MPSTLIKFVRTAAFAVVLCFFAVASAAAQDGIVGDWEGTVSSQGQVVDFVFHVMASEDGTLSATMDVPTQASFGIPVEDPAFTDGVFTFGLSIAPGGASYEGTMSEDGKTLIGTWTQGGGGVELNMTRSEG